MSEVPKTMKALRLNKARKYNENYKLEDIPTPVPDANQVLVRIAAASFCHTDYQVYQGDYKTELPATGSHEPVGTIAAVGRDVSSTSWKVGDRVGVFLFRKPCGSCADCKWHSSTHGGALDARHCKNKAMGGISKADGGFAEYMVTEDDAVMRIPEDVPFEQAAPLMCAGATAWSAIRAMQAPKGATLAIVGIGGVGILGVQFARALGYRVVAIGSRDVASNLDTIPGHLREDLYVNRKGDRAAQQVLDFTGGTGLDAAVITSDSSEANDWTLQQLHPRGVAVVLGLPVDGLTFDAMNLVFREIVIKGSVHSSVPEMEEMLQVAAENKVRSQISCLPLAEAESLPEKTHNREIEGRAVVLM